MLLWAMVTGSGGNLLPSHNQVKWVLDQSGNYRGSGERKMNIFSWLVSSRWIRLNPGSSWGREKCLVQQLGKGICPGSVLYCGKLWYWDLINCKIWNRTIFCSTVVVKESSHHLSSGLIPRRSQISSPLLPRN